MATKRGSYSVDPIKRRALEPEPPRRPVAKTERAASRKDARAMTVWISPEAHDQLRDIAHEHRKRLQHLGEEMLNDLFEKYGKHRIATVKAEESGGVDT